MKKAVKFYRDDLGFQTTETSDNPELIFFDTPGTRLELYPLELLAQDIDPNNPPAINPGFGGITFAHNVSSKDQVHEVIELARKAGAKIVKEPQDVFWNGYHAYFTDLDGYYCEVAYNPFI